MKSNVLSLCALGFLVAACAQESTAQNPRVPNQNYPGAYPNTQYPGAYQNPAGQYPTGNQYPSNQYPNQTVPTPTPTPQPVSGGGVTPAPPGSFDASGAMTPAFIRAEAKSVLDELVANLDDTSKARVIGIPLVVIEDPQEVNAFAGCDKSGKAYMGITAPLLILQASSSEAKAFDELNGTQRYDQYTSDVAAKVRAGQPVAASPPGYLALPQALDLRKLSRQRFVFDEQLAFVLGHELAHHYRGHTGCANGVASGGVGPDDAARLLSSAVPLFNQPMEIEADVNGINSVLTTGSRRQTGSWNEEGAMLTLNFFARLSSIGVETVLLGFLRTHPPPQIRIPIVQGAAQQWRQRGGAPMPTFPFPLPIPGLSN